MNPSRISSSVANTPKRPRDAGGNWLAARLLGLAVFVAAGLLGRQPLFANPPSRGEVNVVIAGNDRSFAAITKSLTEAMSFISVTAGFEKTAAIDPHSIPDKRPPPPSCFARLWVDATASLEITLYITDASAERVFVRRIGLDHGLDTVAIESLALVAQSSLEALLAGQPIGMSRDDYEHSLEPAPAPPAVRVPEKPRTTAPFQVESRVYQPSRWQLAAGYQLEAWDRVTVRHEAAIGVAYERWALRFGVDLFTTWPVQFQSGDSGADVFSNGVRLQLSRPIELPHRFRLLPGLGFAIELSRVRPELSSPDAQPASPYFAVDPSVRAVLGIERSLGRWSLRGLVGLDFAPRPVRYVVTDQSQTEVVRTPWRERPFGAIVLGAGL